jgi:hypothetical protein
MSDTKTKAELLEMLAEAVRNTQPQPVGNTQPEPPATRKPRAHVKCSPAKRAQRRSAQPKLKTFRHLLAASYREHRPNSPHGIEQRHPEAVFASFRAARWI